MHDEEPPPIVDESGMVIAIPWHEGDTPRKAFRRLCEEFREVVESDFMGHWIEDRYWRPYLSEYRTRVKRMDVEYWRPYEPGDPDTEWGSHSWWPCWSEHPAAVKFWATGT